MSDVDDDEDDASALVADLRADEAALFAAANDGGRRRSTRTSRAPCRYEDEFREDIMRVMLEDVPASELNAALGVDDDDAPQHDESDESFEEEAGDTEDETSEDEDTSMAVDQQLPAVEDTSMAVEDVDAVNASVTNAAAEEDSALTLENTVEAVVPPATLTVLYKDGVAHAHIPDPIPREVQVGAHVRTVPPGACAGDLVRLTDFV